MPLFEVCVIHEETKKKEEELVRYPEWVVAKDEKSAAFQYLLDLTRDEQ